VAPAFHQDIRFAQSADGTRLAYAVVGEGFPLVRAAHWLTNIDLDWQTPMWGPWFDALGARYRFYRYDSRGCGLSDRDAIDATLDVLVADLEAVVDAAGLDRFALLGTSQGGAAQMRPDAERARKLLRAAQADRDRLGTRQPRVPSAFHESVFPERDARASAVVQ
jgi:pimeloyl-ACP methyl ester carboxylesterase